MDLVGSLLTIDKWVVSSNRQF